MLTNSESLKPWDSVLSPPGLNVGFKTEFSWLRQNFFHYLEQGFSVSAPVVHLRPLPFLSIYLISDPSLAHQITGSMTHLFVKSNQTRTMVGKFLGNGLVLSEGSEHQVDRKVISRLFAQHLTDAKIKATCLETLESISSPVINNVEVFFEELAFSLIVKLIFPTCDQSAQQNLQPALRSFAEAIAGRFLSLPLPQWIPTQRNREERAAILRVDQALHSLFQICQEGFFAGDLKTHYQNTVPAKAAKQWSDQMKTLLFAGHETIARLLSWSLYHLALDPALQTRFENDPEPNIDAFIQEILRFRPPVWVFDRSPTEDVILEGYKIPRGAKIYLSPYLFGRDPRYFKNPETFDARRFLGPEANNKTAFLPFGLGARSCVGRHVAMIQTKAILKALLTRYEIGADKNNLEQIKMRPGASLGMTPALKIELRPRT